MDAPKAARRMIELTTSRPWGLMVAAIRGDETSIAQHPGADELSEASTFQIGSVTKTMTGVLLADAVCRGEVGLETCVGDVLQVSGPAAKITLLELATQRSGLPRLPPNIEATIEDRADPYASYSREDLIAAASALPSVGGGAYCYSNMGFMLLGLVLSSAASQSMASLLHSRLFVPLRMTDAGCPPSESSRVPGYNNGALAAWWTTQLPGAGGVGASIRDLCSYLRSHLEPGTSPTGRAIQLATDLHARGENAMGLGWGQLGGGHFHDGGTGGFSAFVAFHRPTQTAVAMLANGGALDLAKVGLQTLTEMARS